MATNENLIPIPGRLHDVSTDGVVSGANEIYDDTLGKRQSELNGGILVEKDSTNGMGRKVLKPNLSFESQVTEPNTIYVIQHDFTLASDVTIPANCVLEFDGGSISGAYTLTGTNTSIYTGLEQIFDTNTTLGGIWNIDGWYPEWFGNIPHIDGTFDSAPYIQSALNAANSTNIKKVQLLTNTYYIFNSLIIYSNCELSGAITPYWYGVTLIVCKDNTKDAVICRGDNNGTININIHHLTFRSGLGSSNCGVRFEETEKPNGFNIIEHVYFIEFKYGVYIDGSGDILGNHIRDCQFHRNQIGVYVYGHMTCAFNINKFTNLYFNRNLNCTIWIEDTGACSGNIIDRCSFDSTGANYNLADFNTYGVFAIKFTSESGSVAQGNTIISNAYFENTRPRRDAQSGSVQEGEILEGGEIIPINYWKPFTIDNKEQLLNGMVYVQGGYDVTIDNADLYETGRIVTTFDNSSISIDNTTIHNSSAIHCPIYLVSIIKDFPVPGHLTSTPIHINIGSGVMLRKGPFGTLNNDFILIDTPLYTYEVLDRYTKYVTIDNNSLLDGGKVSYKGNGKCEKVFVSANQKVSTPYNITESGCYTSTRGINALSKASLEKIDVIFVGDNNTVQTQYMGSDTRTYNNSAIHRPIHFYSNGTNNVVDVTSDGDFTIFSDITIENITFVRTSTDGYAEALFWIFRKGVNIKFVNCRFESPISTGIFRSSDLACNIVFDSCTFAIAGETLHFFNVETASDIDVRCYSCINEISGQVISQAVPIKWY